MQQDNYFIILGLPVDPPELDPARIESAIQGKQREWSGMQGRGGRQATRAKRYLEMIPDMKAALANPQEVGKIAQEAKEILRRKKQEEVRKLDESISFLSLKGFVTEEEIERLAKKLRSFSVPEIRRRIKVEVQAKKVGESRKAFDSTRFDRILDDLSLVGKQDLYDFFELEPSTSLKKLNEAAIAEDRRLRRIAKKDTELSARQRLVGECLSVFKTEEAKQAYDSALAHQRLKKLNHKLDLAGLDERIQLHEYEELLKSALELGLDQEEAQSYIAAYAKKRNWALELPAAPRALALRQCVRCRTLNPPDARACSQCGYPLEVRCPGCKENRLSAERYCGKCRFPLGDMPNAVNLVSKGEQLVAKGRFAEAENAFRKALQFWPKHPLATQRLEEISRRISDESDLAEKLASLVNQGAYHAASAIASKLKKAAPGNPALRAQATIDAKLREAQKWLSRARSLDSDDDVYHAYSQALKICRDHPEARSALKRVPPAPPRELDAQPAASSISLQWKPSPSVGVTAYAVVRRAGSFPSDPSDGTRVAKTAQTAYADDQVEPGASYFYAVFAHRNQAVSTSAALAGPAMAAGEVAELQAEPGDGYVAFRWKAPRKADEVEVWRKKGTPPSRAGDGVRVAGASLRGLHDSGLVNGAQYGYLISVKYRGHTGGMVRSAGLAKVCSPTRPPEPILDLRAAEAAEGINLSWTAPNSGTGKIILSPNRPKLVPGRRMAADQLDELGRPLHSSRPGQAFFRPKHSKTWAIPATVAAGLAVIGKPVAVVSVEDVGGLRGYVRNGRVYLDWQWPETAEQVRVAYRHDRYPAGPQEPQHIDFTAAQYRASGGFEIRNPPRLPHYFKVFTMIESDSGLAFSKGQAALVTLEEVREIRYEIQVIRNLLGRPKGARLRMFARNGSSLFPAVALVCKAGRPPLRKTDGQIVFECPSKNDQGPLSWDIPQKALARDLYAKLFLVNEDDTGRFRLLAPGNARLRLF